MCSEGSTALTAHVVRILEVALVSTTEEVTEGLLASLSLHECVRTHAGHSTGS